MNIMSFFQTNWLDFLMWTLAGCMGIALLAHMIQKILPSGMMEQPKEIVNFSKKLRKAS